MAFDTNSYEIHNSPVLSGSQTASEQDADQYLSVPTSEVYATTALTNAPSISDVQDLIEALRKYEPELWELRRKIDGLSAISSELERVKRALDDAVANDAWGNPRWESFLSVDLTRERQFPMRIAAEVCIEISGFAQHPLIVRRWIASEFQGVHLGRFPNGRLTYTSNRYLREYLREIAQLSDSERHRLPFEKKMFMSALRKAVLEAQAKATFAVQGASSASDTSR